MKIKQVEELVGITRKNIRFYEEEHFPLQASPTPTSPLSHLARGGCSAGDTPLATLCRDLTRW